MDDLPPGPGFHELDTITHCSHTTKGEYLRTLTTTDPVTGSTLIHAIRNNTHINIKAGMDWIRQHSPAPIPGMDFDNEPRPLNKLHSLVMKRKNFLLPCVKATSWTHTSAGRKKRVYDKPKTPLPTPPQHQRSEPDHPPPPSHRTQPRCPRPRNPPHSLNHTDLLHEANINRSRTY